jgi:hypothetical protein
MPKRQSTAAQMARLRQAGTGERYTAALRAVQADESKQFRMFNTDGAGWAPIIERADRQLAQIWPAGPRPHWEENFGKLCVKPYPWGSAPDEVVSVLLKAFAESAVTCQACPSPGRKRVVWIWNDEYGWVAPWVKTCCDDCYWVPRNLVGDRRYQDLFDMYEAPVPYSGDGCCQESEDVTSAVREEFEHGGVPALLAKLEELRRSMWRRSPHNDLHSGHGIVVSVERACTPMLLQTEVVGAPGLPPAERRQVTRAINGLFEALSEMEAEEHRD